MAERHTVDFDRISFNVLSDAERGTITLQFDSEIGRHQNDQLKRLLSVLRYRYGASFMSRLRRWSVRAPEPLLLVGSSGPHPENADILCLELRLNREARLESALVDLVEFLRRQPGYRRLLGQPLDRGQMRERTPTFSSDDSSQAAADTLKRMMERRLERG
jgi:hypothetical protein